MIDIHCHLLPEIDDGPSNMDEALALASDAVAQGISHSIVTPHIHIGRYNNNLDTIAASFSRFKQALSEKHIDLTLSYGAEVRIDSEILFLIEKQQIPFLGEVDGYQHLLLEMPHNHILVGSENLIKWLMARQIRPIIAHPERNKEIQKNLSKLASLVQLGCQVQLTAASILGRFGAAAEQTAKAIIANEWVNYVATDAHNRQHRPPILGEAYQYLVLEYGQDKADLWCANNPQKLIS